MLPLNSSSKTLSRDPLSNSLLFIAVKRQVMPHSIWIWWSRGEFCGKQPHREMSIMDWHLARSLLEIRTGQSSTKVNHLTFLKSVLSIWIYLSGLVIHQSIALAGLKPKTCSKVILETGHVLQVHIEEAMSMELHRPGNLPSRRDIVISKCMNFNLVI